MRVCLIVLMFLMAAVPLPAADGGRILGLTIDSPITPVIAQFVHRSIGAAARSNDRLVLIELDTPGGLDTAMRGIVKDILASPVPVVVYVSPSGARAASAGAIITLAGDIGAMAPGTNIGAAHPVSVGWFGSPDKIMENKVVNDAAAYVEGLARQRGRNEELARDMVTESISLSAEKALQGRLIDLIATDRAELLQKLEGRVVMKNGRQLTLHLAGAPIVTAGMGTGERILNIISDPDVAYLLMMLGMLGLFFELANPGVILPGVIGGISLILSFFAFQSLPVNYAGVLLILLALVLFVADIKIASHGILTIGGVIAMVFGSLLLYESPEPYLRVSWGVIAVTVVTVSGFFVFVVTKVVRAHQQRPSTGREGLVGQEGKADSAIAPSGKVFVNGEYWDAWSDDAIPAGAGVVVEVVDGMRLKVRKISPGQSS